MEVNKLMQASEKGINFLLSHLGENGVFSNEEAQQDICTVYKLPTLLLLSGREKLANLILDHIKTSFMLENGDFVSYKIQNGGEDGQGLRKTKNGALAHFWSYMNGWIAMAAHRLGRFDISYPAFQYMKTFYNPVMNSVNVTEAFIGATKGQDQEVDIMMNAHLGLAALYFGDLKLAKTLGDSIQTFIDKQPDISTEFLLRMSTETKTFVPSGSEELSPFYRIKVAEPNQLYFILGYPVIFLTKLYKTTGNQTYLQNACKILDFLATCDESVYNFNYSHKVAYGAALVARETKNTKYREMSNKITRHLLSIQTDAGDFLPAASLLDNLDQTTEISLWFQEISVELR